MDNTHYLTHYNKPISNDPSFSSMENNENEDMMMIKKKNNKKNKKGSLGNGSKREMKLSTEPQSVAARERRHRISERFKILQSLVPGGTKMDTASMLEQAIQYVKFLKSQIWLHQAIFNTDHFHHHHHHGHVTSHHGHGHGHGHGSHYDHDHDHDQSLYSQDVNHECLVMSEMYGQSTWSYGDHHHHEGEDAMSFDASSSINYK